MFQVLMLVAQLALMAASAACGWAATPEGGALLLASLWCMGANLGWLIRERVGGDDR